jgi:hypothetical protein
MAQIHDSRARRTRFRNLAEDRDAWMYGGGPTWRSGSYDPELDLVYWGTGNAEPCDPRPREGMDSLFTSSVLAIRSKTGEIVCHFQYTPNDVYDLDGADEHVLADLRVDGQQRKVMIQANKNGFMYVLDRTNCSLISAHPYVKINWATHVDLKTGRPVLTDLYKRFLAGDEVEIWPSRGSNAVPIAFNPDTGLVYASTWNLPRIQKLAGSKAAVGTVDQIRDLIGNSRDVRSVLLGLLGTIGLVLVGLAVCGGIAYSVARRARATGTGNVSARSVAHLVLDRGVLLAWIGLVFGIGGRLH